jgi:hypothetical protein
LINAPFVILRKNWIRLHKGIAMMNDMVLRRNILDELEFEPSLNAANIGVLISARN